MEVDSIHHLRQPPSSHKAEHHRLPRSSQTDPRRDAAALAEKTTGAEPRGDHQRRSSANSNRPPIGSYPEVDRNALFYEQRNQKRARLPGDSGR